MYRLPWDDLRPSDEVEELNSFVERFVDLFRAADDPAQALTDVAVLAHVRDLIDLKMAESAAIFANSDLYESIGDVSPIATLRDACKIGSGAAADRWFVGNQLDLLAASVDALRNGEIGYAHLSLIGHTTMALRDSGTGVPLAETEFLPKAKTLNVRFFREFCEHARHAGDPKGKLAEEQESVELRKLSISSGEKGAVFIRGVLDSTGGAVLRTALEPLARKQGSSDYRSREQRLADGLVELAAHATGPAHVQVTTSLETLMGAVGAAGAEMEFSMPLCTKTVERLSCNCSLTRVLLGAESMVFDVGRAKRVVSGSQMRALRVRDKHCRWPGCERPASWTEAHHVIHWAHGGPTDLRNLVLLCNRHHWMVHEGEWQLVLAADGELRVVPPQRSFRYWARGPDAEAA